MSDPTAPLNAERCLEMILGMCSAGQIHSRANYPNLEGDFSAIGQQAELALAALRAQQAQPVAQEHQFASNETDRLLLDAWTPERYAGDYPPYINLTMLRMQGDVVLTVRSPTSFGKPPGATSSVRFNRDLWQQFVALIEKADSRFKAAYELDQIL